MMRSRHHGTQRRVSQGAERRFLSEHEGLRVSERRFPSSRVSASIRTTPGVLANATARATRFATPDGEAGDLLTAGPLGMGCAE